jgi:hypothetical protein
MKPEVFILRTLVAIIAIMLLSSVTYFSNFLPSVSGTGDKGFCYDQVGDGHFCFETEKLCDLSQRNDQISESPCYDDL